MDEVAEHTQSCRNKSCVILLAVHPRHYQAGTRDTLVAMRSIHCSRLNTGCPAFSSARRGVFRYFKLLKNYEDTRMIKTV